MLFERHGYLLRAAEHGRLAPILRVLEHNLVTF
jgi:hypothetical protein